MWLFVCPGQKHKCRALVYAFDISDLLRDLTEFLFVFTYFWQSVDTNKNGHHVLANNEAFWSVIHSSFLGLSISQNCRFKFIS